MRINGMLATLIVAAVVAGTLAAGARADTGARPELVTFAIDGVEDGCVEPIAIEGTVMELAQLVTAAGGQTLFHLQFQTRDLRGTGLLTGTEYRDVSGGMSVGTFSETFDRVTGTIDIRVRIFPVGGGDVLTFVLHETFHITKLDFENRVIFDRITVACV